MSRRVPHQRGFGLVELMVALALGLVVVGGAAMIFLATRQANGTSENLSRVQESVRTSYDLMSREVREAGATPCDSQLLMADVLNNAQGGTPDWWAVWTDPVRGYDGATAFPGAAFGAAAGQRVAGTAALIVRYGAAIDNVAVQTHDTATTTFTANRNNHGIAAGELLMVCNYQQGAIFQVTTANTGNGTFVHANNTVDPGNCSKGLGLPTLCTGTGTTFQFRTGALVARFFASGWYIGSNGRAASGGRSLYRATRLGAEEVAEGVRDMQLGFLEAGNVAYVASTAVLNWDRVTAVRVDLIYEGPDVGATSTGDASRLTRPVSFTVNLRNLQP